MTVRIIDNPDREYTSLRSARRYVDSGRAVWVRVDRAIRFIRSHYRNEQVQISVDRARRRSELDYDRAANRGLATPDEVRALPAVGDIMRLYLRRSKGATA